VSKVDLITRRIAKTVTFPEGSKPYMLRVSPNGTVVWVQTAGAASNVVLDATTMEILHTEATGRGPVQSGFGPEGSRYGLVTHLDETFVLALEHETGQEAARIEVGAPQANASITPDGATAYVTVPSLAEVVAIDMKNLAIVGRIQAGEEPMGIVVFDPT
jgi:DNA-binding beta-propeller fold protein YncE